MSEAAPERPTQGRPAQGGAPGKSSIFSRKFGPLPGWAWMALAGAGAVGYLWYRNKQGSAAANAAASGSSTDTSTATGDDVQGQLATIQTEIESLQGSESSEPDSDTSSSGDSDGSSGSSGKSKRAKRHVSTGKESLNQIASAAGTSVAHIVSTSKSRGETDERLDKLQAWAKHPRTRRKGIVYYA